MLGVVWHPVELAELDRAALVTISAGPAQLVSNALPVAASLGVHRKPAMKIK
jgi:hypothetical protein